MLEFFINADFDLSLRRGRARAAGDARARQARELVMHTLLLGVEGDSVLVPAEPGPGFMEYLDRVRLEPPKIGTMPSLRKKARFTPFGWNGEADRLNRLYDRPAPHPALEVVHRVNSRTFSAEIERRHFGGGHVIGEAASIDELEQVLRGRPVEEKGWVAKSEHGNGAFGNRRIQSRHLSAADRAFLERLFEEDERAVVERWRRRVFDVASVFVVREGGGIEGIRIHEVVNTAAGALIGDIFDRRSPEIEKWRPELESMSKIVAEELAAAGYFGPVCVDSCVWNDGGGDCLRPVVDVNARLFVAAAAERLWRSLGRDRVVFWRLFSRKKLRLPETFEGIETALGERAFDHATRCGVLMTSALEFEGRPLKRIGVVLAGVDRRSVDALDRWFRGRFER
jgi:hypothetical protein